MAAFPLPAVTGTGTTGAGNITGTLVGLLIYPGAAADLDVTVDVATGTDAVASVGRYYVVKSTSQYFPVPDVTFPPGDDGLKFVFNASGSGAQVVPYVR